MLLRLHDQLQILVRWTNPWIAILQHLRKSINVTVLIVAKNLWEWDVAFFKSPNQHKAETIWRATSFVLNELNFLVITEKTLKSFSNLPLQSQYYSMSDSDLHIFSVKNLNTYRINKKSSRYFNLSCFINGYNWTNQAFEVC